MVLLCLHLSENELYELQLTWWHLLSPSSIFAIQIFFLMWKQGLF